MYIDPTDGRTYEKCPVCDRRAEVDDAYDARRWGINHWDTYHETHDDYDDTGTRFQ